MPEADVTQVPQLLEVDGLEITILVDNQIDMLLPGDETVRRRPFGPSVANPLIDAPELATTLHAEHGFSALVTIEIEGTRHCLLFDAGLSPSGLIDNMDRLQLSAKDIEAVVLSHGHFDHTGGLTGVVDRLGRANMPMVIHPAAYTLRRSAPPNADPIMLYPPSRSALEGAGFRLIERRDPSALFEDRLLITGEVPRVTEFESGFPLFQRWNGDEWEPEPHLLDDQALIANVKGKGTVVLTGCGHSGIVNIVLRACELTGAPQVHAVIGGFHMPSPAFDAVVPATIDALRTMNPTTILMPGHCTGFKGQQALAAAMPEAYVHPSVGTTIAI